MKTKEQYVAFLRGINVGGHHKLPMADLKKEMEKLGFENIVTLLNSGNVVFDSVSDTVKNLEVKISKHLEQAFEFPVPTIIRTVKTIDELLTSNPFEHVSLTKDIRLYVSLLREDNSPELELPWKNEDGSFEILEVRDKMIISVLDLSVTKTPKGMEALEKMYGKDITTRNWNTIDRIGKKL
ncbi:DUF1697 domain-containing protein [Reichenbachiella sp.]|uniref:DUF1697 domain-containing protein n=1 Tax=Reichenbachiella sp. TaxID=2184521 RepID=UPI003297045E